tara:strand:+ start:10660 stop:10965 length:306 start_codon:yes stop_codon:yes gene_type:complete
MKDYKLYEGLNEPKYYYLLLIEDNDKSIIEIVWDSETKSGGYTAWLKYHDNILMNAKLVEKFEPGLKEYCEMLASEEFEKIYIKEEEEFSKKMEDSISLEN